QRVIDEAKICTPANFPGRAGLLGVEKLSDPRFERRIRILEPNDLLSRSPALHLKICDEHFLQRRDPGGLRFSQISGDAAAIAVPRLAERWVVAQRGAGCSQEADGAVR